MAFKVRLKIILSILIIRIYYWCISRWNKKVKARQINLFNWYSISKYSKYCSFNAMENIHPTVQSQFRLLHLCSSYRLKIAKFIEIVWQKSRIHSFEEKEK